MAIGRRTVRYTQGDKTFEAIAIWDDQVVGQRPAVLVAPTFMDRSPFEEARGERLARAGYVAFVIDLFGIDVNPATMDEAMAAMLALDADRPQIAARMTEALAQTRALDLVDPGQIAAIGFCLGGKCVLDLARTGVAIAGVASFHGLFDPPQRPSTGKVLAKTLVLHGWADPLVPPQAVLALTEELDAAQADWEFVAYGHTGHAFTNDGIPAMHAPLADERSWTRLDDFLTEVFR